MNPEFPETEGPPLQRAMPYLDDPVTRCPPHAVGPEKAVLSVMLQFPEEFIPKAQEEGVRAEHFYLPHHSIIFGVLCDLYEKTRSICNVDLIQHLLDHGLLDRIGGGVTLTDLYTYQPSPQQWTGHVAHLRAKRVLRQIIEVGNTAVQESYNTPEDAMELLDQVETKLLAIRETDRPSTGFSTGKQAMASVMSELQDYCDGKQQMRGIPTGFDGIDHLIGGLKPGEMTIIAARPSMGKTALLMNIVDHACIAQGIPSVVFTCEMTSHQLGSRMCFSRARFCAQKLMRGQKPDMRELVTIRSAAMAISQAKLVIDETSGITVAELRAKALRLHREGRASLIAVDYLQLMRSHSKQATGSREREIGEISAGLKALAKELMVPVIVAAQLNRDSEKRGKGETRGMPRIADLRESGNIEQDADIIALLHRPEYFAENDTEREQWEGKATLIVAKNRNGATGPVPLTFIADQVRFESGSPAQETTAYQPSLPAKLL